MKIASIAGLAPVLALVLAACGASRHDVAEIYGGEGALAVLEGAPARAWLLDPEHRSDGPHEPEPSGYPELEGPLALSPELGARLGRALAEPGTYLGPGIAKACLPRYGVRVEFAAHDTAIDVVFCFECSMLLAYRDGAYAGDAHFDPGRRRLAGLASEAFPAHAGLRRFAEAP